MDWLPPWRDSEWRDEWRPAEFSGRRGAGRAGSPGPRRRRRSPVVDQLHNAADESPEPPRPRSITKAFGLRHFLRVPSWPWWLTISKLSEWQCARLGRPRATVPSCPATAGLVLGSSTRPE